MIYVKVIKGTGDLELFLNKQNVRDDIITITQNGDKYTIIYKN